MSDQPSRRPKHVSTASGPKPGIKPGSKPGTKAGRHVPVRTCVVCRDKENKRALTRIVRSDTGVQVDPTGKMNGRGAYLCDRDVCWQRAVSSDVLEKALRARLTAEDRERLKQAYAMAHHSHHSTAHPMANPSP